MAPRRAGRSKGSEGRRKERSARCFRPGPVTRSPFLNFVRSLRMRMRGAPLTEITRRAGAEWRRMSDSQKQPFYRMAQEARRAAPSKRRKRK